MSTVRNMSSNEIIDCEIRHVTKPGELFKDLGIDEEEAAIIEAEVNRHVNNMFEIRTVLLSYLKRYFETNQEYLTDVVLDILKIRSDLQLRKKVIKRILNYTNVIPSEDDVQLRTLIDTVIRTGKTVEVTVK